MTDPDAIRRRCRERLPDLPQWVETRDLLAWEDSVVVERANPDGFAVWSVDDGIGSIVGLPPPEGVARMAAEVPELLAFPDNIAAVQALLPHFDAEPATVLAAPARLPERPPHGCRIVDRDAAAAMRHLPADLHEELLDAAGDGALTVAALADGQAVAFAYVASQTETLWDVSIDTIASHRRQGFAAAAVVDLMHRMAARGRTAVWGALESNVASLNLALRLGFAPVATLWVLTRPADEDGPRATPAR